MAFCIVGEILNQNCQCCLAQRWDDQFCGALPGLTQVAISLFPERPSAKLGFGLHGSHVSFKVVETHLFVDYLKNYIYIRRKRVPWWTWKMFRIIMPRVLPISAFSSQVRGKHTWSESRDSQRRVARCYWKRWRQSAQKSSRNLYWVLEVHLQTCSAETAGQARFLTDCLQATCTVAVANTFAWCLYFSYVFARRICE